MGWIVVVPWWLAIPIIIARLTVLIVLWTILVSYALLFWLLQAGWRAWQRHREDGE